MTCDPSSPSPVDGVRAGWQQFRLSRRREERGAAVDLSSSLNRWTATAVDLWGWVVMGGTGGNQLNLSHSLCDIMLLCFGSKIF